MSLERARSRKTARAFALATVHESYDTLAAAVRGATGELRRCPLWLVLLAWPGMGPRRARRVCERADVWPLTPLDELTSRELERLEDELNR